MASNVTQTRTIQDMINLKDQDPLTYYNLSILAKSITDDGILYSSNNIIYDYMEELDNIAQNVTMNDKEYIRYCYKPKLLAYDVYGSTELYFVLLALNGTCNVKDFNKKTFRAVKADVLLDYLNRIYNAEEEYIRYNRNSVGETVPY